MKETRELRKVAEGREAEMFAWGEGTILRLLRNPQAQAETKRACLPQSFATCTKNTLRQKVGKYA